MSWNHGAAFASRLNRSQYLFVGIDLQGDVLVLQSGEVNL